MELKTKDITNELFKDVEQSKTKISKRVGAWLQKDFLREVVLYGSNFWFTGHNIHNYVYDYIVRWGNKKGYTHISQTK